MTLLFQKVIIFCSCFLFAQSLEAGMLYSYAKQVGAHTTYELVRPDYEQHSDIVPYQELCTINGLTFVWMPDAATLPAQPKQVSDTLKQVLVTPQDLVSKSRFLQLAKDRFDGNTDVVRYSEKDELLLKSIANMELSVLPVEAFITHIEAWREWDIFGKQL